MNVEDLHLDMLVKKYSRTTDPLAKMNRKDTIDLVAHYFSNVVLQFFHHSESEKQ